jgi:hypothetical protein
MNLIEKITITNLKLSSLVNASETFNKTGMLFLGENSSKGYVILDDINFGFLSFFPIFSNFTNINVANLISYFFFFLFAASLMITLISCYNLCINKNKILPLFSIIILLYFLIYKYILTVSAEYFIYFFWGVLPLAYYFIENKKIEIQILFNLVFSFLIIILGSLLYYSFISFLIFYLIVIYFDKNTYYKKIKYIVPIISFVVLIFFQGFSNNIAFKNISLIKNITLDKSNYPREIGNNAFLTFYVGLGYLNSDYFDAYFDDQEIFKLVHKIKPNGTRKEDSNLSNKTQLSTQDISMVKKKIVFFIFDNPLFIFKVVFAKIGVLLGYFLIIGNFSLIYFFSSKVDKKFKYPLILNLLFSLIIPIISIPSKLYALTFIGASTAIFTLSYCKNKKII